LQHEGEVPDSLLESWVELHLGLQLPPPVPRRAAPPAKKAAASAPGVESVESFVARTLPLLELERAAEEAQGDALHSAGGVEEAVSRGACLTGLRVMDCSPGFLGRTVLSLALARGGDAPLPAHKFGPHDIVALRPSRGAHDAQPIAKGVVSRVSDSRLDVALDEAPDDTGGVLRVERLANEVTHTRLREALASLMAAGSGAGAPQPGSRLAELLFSGRPPLPIPDTAPLKPLNAALDGSQMGAVRLALAAPELALIHGPPGTGKTTALVELVLQSVKRGERVLCSAASNAAVDNLVERCVGCSLTACYSFMRRLRAASPKLRIVRLGHPARLSPAVLESSLEAAVQRADSSALASDCRKEMKALAAKLLKLGSHQRAERREARGQLSRLGREERQRSKAAVQEVLATAQVVAATLSGALSHALRTAVREGPPLDLLVIDEAAQALEAACWGPMLMARRAVLAGDHLQVRGC